MNIINKYAWILEEPKIRNTSVKFTCTFKNITQNVQLYVVTYKTGFLILYNNNNN
jgi:hypothetical protein